MSVQFTVHGTAAPAGSKKGFINRKTGRVIITDASKGSRPWKSQISSAAVDAMAGRDPLDGPLLLELTFWVARPKGHYGSGKNAGVVKGSAPFAPTVRPDVLKLARGVEDALTTIVYRDDAQITTEILQKAYTTGSARTEIRVVQIEEPGQQRPVVEGETGQLELQDVAA